MSVIAIQRASNFTVSALWALIIALFLSRIQAQRFRRLLSDVGSENTATEYCAYVRKMSYAGDSSNTTRYFQRLERTRVENTHHFLPELQAESLSKGFCSRNLHDATYPHMTPAETDFFMSILTKADFPDKVVMEWGTGGSTNLFAHHANHTYSIENALDYCNIMLSKDSVKCYIKSNRLTYACLNETKKVLSSMGWGFHSNATAVGQQAFRRYIDIADELIRGDQPGPHVVFVDGRFRAAAALKATQLFVQKNIKGMILFHDYCNRFHYHHLEHKFLDLVQTVDSLAVLVPKDNIDLGELTGELEKWLTNEMRI